MADYDVLVIGAGPGGYPTAIRASQLGLNVAVVEREKVGGVCLNWGCIPSKALLKTAELANKIRKAESFGLTVGELGVDYEAVIARSRKVSAKFERGVAGLFKKYGVTLLEGTAKLVDAATVDIDGKQVTASHIVVATGASARSFENIRPDGEAIWSYREAIVATEQPSSVTVLGAGAIGLEFAYFWHAMGTKVTVVEGMSEILPREDKQTAAVARKQMAKLGIEFKLGVFVDSVSRDGDGTLVKMADGTELRADRTLIAMGISPNTTSLGLDEVGVALSRGFIEIDKDMKTNVPGIYAVGDCTTKGGLAHTATRQGEICAERIAGHHVPDLDYDCIPSATYCQPQVASVGQTEEQLKEAGTPYKLGSFPFSANGKATGAGSNKGFVKVLLGEEHGEILGAHIVGSEATELLAEMVLARANELTSDELLHAIHAHPTYSEALFEAVAVAEGQSVHL